MRSIGIIYHSAHGHTALFGAHVAKGARSAPKVAVREIPVSETGDPRQLVEYDGFIFGSPTYLGGVSAPFKSFMDSTGALWRSQALRGRLAAGFTVSSLPSGDKQTTLLSMFVFAMQHGMIWIGNPFLPGTFAGEDAATATNRLGSWSGAMAQAAHGTPAQEAFTQGDLRAAEMFGRNFADTLLGFSKDGWMARIPAGAQVG